MNSELRNRLRKAAGVIVGAGLAVSAIAFAASQASAQTATTTDTTASSTATSTATTTAPTGPEVSGVLVWNNLDGRGATVTWITDVPATTRVYYGTDQLYLVHATDDDVALTTSHSATLTDLEPGTSYYFTIASDDASSMSNSAVYYLFTTLSPVDATATSTAVTSTDSTSTAAMSTDTTSLQARVSELESQVSALQSRIATLMAEVQALMSGSTSTGTTTTSVSSNSGATGSVSLTPSNASVRAGTSIDFNGRGFGADEPVSVMESGTIIATAHADSAGNFSTGSLPVSNTLGSRTYTFVGSRSGLTGTATYKVTQ
jgi:hypothetical protein